MPSQHKTKVIGWHPEDPTLKEWVKDRAARTGVTIREYLDGVLAEHREKVAQQDALAARARAALPGKQQATTTEGQP